MGFLDSIGTFLTDNSSWLKPAAQVATAGYSTYNKNEQAQGYMNYLRDQEKQNYDNYVTNRDAYLQYYSQNQGGSGGGGGRSSNNSAQLKAQKAAMEREKQGYADARKSLQPFYDAGVKLLPNQSAVYGQGLDNLSLLAAYQMKPEVISQMNQSKPSWETNVPLPDYLRK